MLHRFAVRPSNTANITRWSDIHHPRQYPHPALFTDEHGTKLSRSRDRCSRIPRHGHHTVRIHRVWPIERMDAGRFTLYDLHALPAHHHVVRDVSDPSRHLCRKSKCVSESRKCVNTKRHRTFFSSMSFLLMEGRVSLTRTVRVG